VLRPAGECGCSQFNNNTHRNVYPFPGEFAQNIAGLYHGFAAPCSEIMKNHQSLVGLDGCSDLAIENNDEEVAHVVYLLKPQPVPLLLISHL
jgi:hypothetical protein